MAKKDVEYWLDTNVLVRFLVGDVMAQKEQAARWFSQAQEGKMRLCLTPLVVAETAFVLESFYQTSREDVVDSLGTIVAQRWIKVLERKVLLKVWDKYLEGFHFVDSYLMAKAELSEGEVLTFDKKMLESTR